MSTPPRPASLDAVLASAREARLVRKIVIADPDKAFGTLLEEHLERRGYTVTRVAETASAFRSWSELQADVLVTALDVDALEELELLTALAARRDPPTVIACTRRAGGAALGGEALRALGIARLVPRPCRLRDIEAAIAEAVAARAAGAVQGPSRSAAAPATRAMT